MPQNARDTLGTAWILFATAFAAGAVGIIGFTKLGGVFASAMTGNFALLAYHVAKGNTLSAIGSAIALSGFVSGCLIGFALRFRPHRPRHREPAVGSRNHPAVGVSPHAAEQQNNHEQMGLIA